MNSAILTANASSDILTSLRLSVAQSGMNMSSTQMSLTKSQRIQKFFTVCLASITSVSADHRVPNLHSGRLVINHGKLCSSE